MHLSLLLCLHGSLCPFQLLIVWLSKSLLTACCLKNIILCCYIICQGVWLWHNKQTTKAAFGDEIWKWVPPLRTLRVGSYSTLTFFFCEDAHILWYLVMENTSGNWKWVTEITWFSLMLIKIGRTLIKQTLKLEESSFIFFAERLRDCRAFSIKDFLNRYGHKFRQISLVLRIELKHFSSTWCNY